MLGLARWVGVVRASLLAATASGALALLAAAPAPQPQAQDAGIAAIVSPLEGATVSGVVPIAGTATHPQFQRYELAFAYSANPTDTWFSVQDAVAVPVVNDVLARWDTRQISDGTYILRLRVFFADGMQEALVANVRVENVEPTATPAPATAEPAVATSAPTPTQPAIILPPTSTARPTAAGVQSGNPPPPAPGDTAPRISTAVIGAAFLAGVRLTLISFLLLGAYVSLKAALRAQR